MKQIKVTDEIKAELDAIRYDKETYNLAIHRLIRECKRLFIENQRLYHDKDLLLKIVADDDSISADGLQFKYVPFIESVLFDNVLTDSERLDYLKKYFTEIDAIDKQLLLDCILIVKESNDISGGPLIEFESWINENDNGNGDADEWIERIRINITWD